MNAPARELKDSARCGVFGAMCHALRSQIEDGSFANEHRHSPTAALRDAGFTAAEVIEYLDDVCEAVIPRPGDWAAIENATSLTPSKMEAGK
ncbi:MAG TPA: hypothetical protein DEA80_16360 [Afipia sp.]|nr:hypothetical protein [Afipia sp.]OUX62331.1 MAG: hypothetical protein CBB64_04285 [Afipia sp. TMED4]HAQ93820.1 hypothetical protein [Afipia sp.]HBF53331.1 hypothetical protein [Afipia sp.]HBR46467.1 hypothetical protein [Afipia sp.]|tara:strand:+ start:1001 stop:1276 length:276 start_codon:yes stop_codon:yes gene_type:complete